MAKELYESSLEGRALIDEGCEILGRDLRPILFEGPESELTATHNSQVAIYLHSMAMVRHLQKVRPEIVPAVCAGLSLGEFTAITVAGLLSFADCLRLVQARGRLMSQACEERKGGMAAILGLEDGEVDRVVADLNLPDELWVANYNTPGQVVISGTVEGVERGMAALKEAGARRALALQVHGAFHSGLMESARVGLAAEIDRLSFSPRLERGLVMNVPGGYVDRSELVAPYLIDQVTHSVRWRQGVEAMVEAGVTYFIEMGPRKSLAGMNQRIAKGVTTVSLDKPGDLEQLEGWDV